MNSANICWVVVGSVANISSITKCDGVWISCCAKFEVPLWVSCVFMNVEFKLLVLIDLFLMF